METGATPDELLGWHFLQRDGHLRYLPYVRPEVGKAILYDGPLEVRVSGLHACSRPIDAMEYAPGPRVCRVKLSGGVIRAFDQACAHERTVLWMVDASRLLQEFAAWCAEQAVAGERQAGREPDARSLAAINARKLALQNGNPEPIPSHFWTNAWKAAWETSDGPRRDVAWHAIWFTAEAAAEAATWQAPWLAARAAASAAAKSAAYHVIECTESTANRSELWYDAFRMAQNVQNAELERLLEGLHEATRQ